MMRVVLIHLTGGVDGTPVSPVVDHLGLEMLAGALRAEGCNVTILDTGLMKISTQDALAKTAAIEPDLVGFSLNYVNAQTSIDLAIRIAATLPKTRLIAGGYYATFHDDELLGHGMPFDAIVRGEAENSVRHIVRQDQIARWDSVPGVSFRCRGRVVKTRYVPPARLDLLAPASRECLRLLTQWPAGCRRVAVEASRGCDGSCTFCSISACQHLLGERVRRRVREPKLVAMEIGDIVHEFGLREFWFMDANFLGSPTEAKKALRLADALGGLAMPLELEFDTRADSVSRETIQAFHAVGLKRVFLGVETFYDPLLRAMRKGTTATCNISAVYTLLERGVRPILGIIMFHPNSTVEQIRHDHGNLVSIGYQFTQTLFRLKHYSGTMAADKSDCQTRGARLGDDYGWDFQDPTVDIIWQMFDAVRTQILDQVFRDATKLYLCGRLSLDGFNKFTDKAFSAIGDGLGWVLAEIGRVKSNRIDAIRLATDFGYSLAKSLKPIGFGPSTLGLRHQGDKSL